MIQGCFKGLEKGVSRKFQGSFKDILRVSKESIKCVSRTFQKTVSGVFLECFNEVLFCDFVSAMISLQLPEQREGLFSNIGYLILAI